ncbi:MFS transporter [Luteimonas sp. RD2P54]|uniref:MFS transporter n=1 Tax=Luteimonas endophytica TaxID=3042023 RepID=A0ABT6JDU4_9GAMM|nr:MFS transporter [Luteimonas endophytica]MDH5824994.1 MFS transporter [Luteimonas endophytica]
MATTRASHDTAALTAVSLSSLMFGLEISSVPVILPTLERQLPADFAQMQWIMNAYTLACTSVLMAVGTLGDRYGRKRIFVAGLLLFGLASLVCGLADSAWTLVAARFLQGASGGAILICGTAILSHQFPAGRERARAFAVWGVVFGVGLGFGPIIGGAIVAVSSWRWVFLVQLPLMAATLLPLLAGVRESRDSRARKLDGLGIVSLSLAVFGLVFCITQAPGLGLASPAALGMAAFAIAGFAAFAWAEKTHPHPMFDFSVFRLRDFSGAMVGAAAMNVSFWPFIVFLPIYLQGVLGYGVFAAGACLFAYTLPALVMPPVAERLSLRYRAGRVIPAGLGVIGAGFLLMRAGGSAAHAGWATLLPGLLLAGIGLGLTNTPVTNTTTGAVPGDRAGMASGMDMSARFISLSINIAIMGFILLAGVHSSLRDAFGGQVGAERLRAAAEKVAAGDPSALERGAGLPPGPAAADAAHAALAQGFDWLMLYAALGVWLLAALSLGIFRQREPRELNVSVP